MSFTSSCIAVCAPLTSIAAVLLFMMAHMLRSHNWTFEVLAAKHGWEKEAKASVCRRGALIYLFTSLALWVMMLLQAPLCRLWTLIPSSRSLHRTEERRTREGLLAPADTNASQNGSYTSSSNGNSRGASRRSLGRFGPAVEEATEMSTFNWGQGGIEPSTHAKPNVLQESMGGSSLTENGRERVKSASGLASPSGRRFPNFLRSLTDASTGHSNSAVPVSGSEGGSLSGTVNMADAANGVSAVSAAANMWGRVRGPRSRGATQSVATEAQGTVTIRSDFFPSGPATPTASSAVSSAPQRPIPQQTPYSNNDNNGAPTNLWSRSGGGERDTVDDADFLSDVELDGTRYNRLRQIRASGWGMRRSGDSGAGMAAVARGAATSTTRNRMGSTGAANAGERRSGGAAPTAATTGMVTTLWPAPANQGSRSSTPASLAPGSQQRHLVPNGGPPLARQREKNKHI